MLLEVLKTVPEDISSLESLMTRIPRFTKKGEELREYLCKMVSLGYVLIMMDDYEKIIGLLGFYANDLVNKRTFLSALVVASEYKHQGVGSKLFFKCKELSVSKGMTSISLNVVTDNRNAISFYEKMGLKIEGTGRDEYHFRMFGTF